MIREKCIKIKRLFGRLLTRCIKSEGENPAYLKKYYTEKKIFKNICNGFVFGRVLLSFKVYRAGEGFICRT